MKRKKTGGKPAENGIKAKKSKTQTKAKAVAAGGDDDSDSDSSLDVEKWKKLALQMTGRCECVFEKEALRASFVCKCAKDEVMRRIPGM